MYESVKWVSTKNPQITSAGGRARSQAEDEDVPQFIDIRSLDDPAVADFRGIRDADLRGGGGRTPLGQAENKLCMVESELVLRRLLDAPAWTARIKSLFLSRERYAGLRDFLNERLAAEIPVHVGEPYLLEQISGYRHHGGALAAIHRPAPSELSLERGLDHLSEPQRSCVILIAEGMTNVDNVGTLFRNAAAFGADAIVFRNDCADPLFRKAIRVSMGHVFHVRWAETSEWERDLTRLRDEWNITLLGAESVDGAQPLTNMPRPKRVGFIFGSQKHGLSRESMNACEGLYQIPMYAGVPSINVAVASAVFLYEWRRNAD